MRTLYLDIFSGISGDMFIGALLDLGVDAGVLEKELRKLNLRGYHLHIARSERGSIAGVKFDVHDERCDHGHHDHSHEGTHEHGDSHDHEHRHEEHHHHEHGHAHEHPHEEHYGHTHAYDEHAHGRTFAEIRKIIRNSALSEWVRSRSISVFERIAGAEGKIHGQLPEEVHFHEVGAIDSIIDIVGGCIGLELLGKPRVLASPVTEGQGWVNCAHGRFPIPTPATLAILAERGVAISQCDEPHELITPTGAALLAEFAESFQLLRDFQPEKIGFGLGARENKTRPNVLRAILGSTAQSPSSNDWETDRVAVLETNLDDINSEVLGNFVEQAFAEGALDVFHTAVQMKKNRPGVLLTVLCAASDVDRFSEMILRQTSAFGVRHTFSERRKLQREQVTLETPLGAILVKIGRLNGHPVQIAPEYESCRAVAAAQNIPIKQVYTAAIAASANLKAK